MITEQQANEVRRLASLWATARVRKNLVRVGQGGPRETTENTAERVERAEKEFDNYLATLTEQESP